MKVEKDFEEFIALLNEYEVRYVIVGVGTPEKIAEIEESHTGKYLKEVL